MAFTADRPAAPRHVRAFDEGGDVVEALGVARYDGDFEGGVAGEQGKEGFEEELFFASVGGSEDEEGDSGLRQAQLPAELVTRVGHRRHVELQVAGDVHLLRSHPQLTEPLGIGSVLHAADVYQAAELVLEGSAPLKAAQGALGQLAVDEGDLGAALFTSRHEAGPHVVLADDECLDGEASEQRSDNPP